MLTMIHSNHAQLNEGNLLVDRKFHDGMRKYVSLLRTPILTIHPQTRPEDSTMDLISVPIKELGYQVLTLRTNARGNLFDEEASRLKRAIAESRLVYGGGFGSSQVAFSLGIPYILVLEYDQQTQLTMAVTQLYNPIRKVVRSLRQTWKYLSLDLPAIRRAHSVHCNGYPVFDEVGRHKSRRLLYLDSRMTSDLVIGIPELDQRLKARTCDTPLRLLFSGRYEKVKGALDAVIVAAECIKRGLNIEMHCYGQGSQEGEMKNLAATISRDRARIFVHDAIPYPSLVEVSRTFDIFVCCHIQSDPSCTYLESMGAGLTIVGYGNRMWKRLCETSGAGLWSEIGRPQGVVEGICQLYANRELLNAMSKRARSFALEHTFEIEFQRRTDDLAQTLCQPG